MVSVTDQDCSSGKVDPRSQDQTWCSVKYNLNLQSYLKLSYIYNQFKVYIKLPYEGKLTIGL